MRDVVTKKRRILLAGRKPRISPDNKNKRNSTWWLRYVQGPKRRGQIWKSHGKYLTSRIQVVWRTLGKFQCTVPFHSTAMLPLPSSKVRKSRRLSVRKINWLTHWGRDKMAAISQTTFSNAFSWMKMYEFRLKFHWSLFVRVQLTIYQHWFW